MDRVQSRLKQFRRFVAVIGLVSVLAALLVWPRRGDDQRAAEAGQRERTLLPAASVVHLDADGHPIAPDSAHAPPQAADRAGAAASHDVPAVAEAAPGGGEMVVVGDRLRHYSVARRDAVSGPQVECAREIVSRADRRGDE